MTNDAECDIIQIRIPIFEAKGINAMKHEVTVRIFNRDYRLLTDESAEYTSDLAAALNRRMAEILNGKSTLNSQDAAALIALEACDDLFKTRSNFENVRKQITDYFDEAAASKTRADAAEKKCAEMKAAYEKELADQKTGYEKEIAELSAKVEQLKKELSLRKSFAPDDNDTAEDMIAKDISKALGGSVEPPKYGFRK